MDSTGISPARFMAAFTCLQRQTHIQEDKAYTVGVLRPLQYNTMWTTTTDTYASVESTIGVEIVRELMSMCIQ